MWDRGDGSRVSRYRGEAPALHLPSEARTIQCRLIAPRNVPTVPIHEVYPKSDDRIIVSSMTNVGQWGQIRVSQTMEKIRARMIESSYHQRSVWDNGDISRCPKSGTCVNRPRCPNCDVGTVTRQRNCHLQKLFFHHKKLLPYPLPETVPSVTNSR